VVFVGLENMSRLFTGIDKAHLLRERTDHSLVRSGGVRAIRGCCLHDAGYLGAPVDPSWGADSHRGDDLCRSVGFLMVATLTGGED